MSIHEDTLLQAYLNEIGGSPLMTDEEERQLAARIARGDERAAARLAEANLRYVVSVARQYRGTGLDLADLVSEGNVGLLKAATRYDGRSNRRFVAFAAPFVRQAIEAAVHQQQAAQGTLDDKALQRQAVGRGAPPSPLRSIDAAIPAGSQSSFSLLSLVEDHGAAKADQDTVQEGMVDETEAALQVLNERERQVVCRVYGLGRPQLTMAETGLELGLRRERVRQIRDKALRKMRRYARHAKELLR